MAQYMILIYDDEVSWAGAAPGAMEEIVAEHTAFKNSYQEHLVDGHGLHPTTTATCVRTDSTGELLVTDGAFAETKEALGGYYVIEAANLDEAIAIARHVPARFGGIEIRPIRTFD